MRGLESLGVDSEKYGSLFIPIIMARLPSEISLQIARLTSQEIWVIDDVLNVIQKEVEARELSGNARVKDGRLEEHDHNKSKSNPRREPPTASALTVQQLSWLDCIFCHEKHYSAECKRVPDDTSRMKILREDDVMWRNCVSAKMARKL